MPDPMPRLSQDLPHCGELLRCWSCGGRAGAEGVADLHRWQECDDQDRPEPIILVLCETCGDRIVEPHPRMYHPLRPYQPWPGAMSLCFDCIQRDGTRCRVAQAVRIEQEAPIVAHVRYSRRQKNGTRGEWVRTWSKPATGCDRKETANG